MRKKILIISSFPPTPCGVGTYAQEQLLTFKKLGHTVYTFSFNPSSAASFRHDSKKTLSLIKSFFFLPIHSFDEVYLHFTNGLIWTRHKTWNGYINKTLLMFWTLCLALRFGKKSKLLGHEILTEPLYFYSRWIHGFIYSLFGEVLVHTESEKEDIRKTFGLYRNVRVVAHYQYFTAKYRGSKEDARRDLGIDLEKIVFVSIGFWLKSKGFEDGIRAMASLTDGYHLYVVGSLRDSNELTLRYRTLLKRLASERSNVSLVEGHLSDEVFDKWIVASDAVLLPYHVIWSSGVAARASVLNRPVIYRKHPKLMDQLRTSEGQCFESQDELVGALKGDGGAKRRSLDYARDDKLPTRDDKLPTEDYIRKILFVIGAFGKTVRGGAERFTFELANELSKRGVDLEVWTTDSSEIVSRRHDLNEDDDKDLPFKVRRFPVNDHDETLFNFAHRFLLKGCPFLNKVWIRTNIYGIGMLEALQTEGHRFDVIHLFHYLHGTTHRLSSVFPEKTLIHPFIHNEYVIHHSLIRDLFARVRGVSTNTEVCGKLAMGAVCGLSPRFYVPIGNGVEAKVFDPKEETQFNGNYILFLGRMIGDKNLDLLFQWHDRLLRENPKAPDLLCVGSGPKEKDFIFKNNKRIKHLPWMNEVEKNHVLSKALALVQLSKLESFSLVIMEAWLAGIPVIVHADSPALVGHLERSKGGFVVGTYEDYAEAVLASTEERKTCGLLGKRYVEEHYSWDKVCANYLSAVDTLLS